MDPADPQLLPTDTLAHMMRGCARALDWKTYCALRGTCRELAAANALHGITTHEMNHPVSRCTICRLLIDECAIASVYMEPGQNSVVMNLSNDNRASITLFSHTNHFITVQANDIFVIYSRRGFEETNPFCTELCGVNKYTQMLNNILPPSSNVELVRVFDALCGIMMPEAICAVIREYIKGIRRRTPDCICGMCEGAIEVD